MLGTMAKDKRNTASANAVQNDHNFSIGESSASGTSWKSGTAPAGSRGEEGLPLNGAAASRDSQAHWHTKVPASAAPVNAFAVKPWVRVLSVCLSLLLALTMFDASALTSYADEVGEASTPLADTASDGGVEEDAAKADRSEWAATVQGEALDAEALAGLMPKDTVAAEEVLPQVTTVTEGVKKEDAADLASRLRPNLVVSGAPYGAGTGLYVKGVRAQAVFELGNLEGLLQGGHLAGSKPGDRFVLTLEVPYLYTDDDGTVATSYSQEEWKLRTALTAQASQARAGAEGAPSSLAEARAAAARAAADPATVNRAMRGRCSPREFRRAGRCGRSTAAPIGRWVPRT